MWTMVGWLHMTWRRTSDGADDQFVRIRTSSTGSTQVDRSSVPNLNALYFFPSHTLTGWSCYRPSVHSHLRQPPLHGGEHRPKRSIGHHHSELHRFMRDALHRRTVRPVRLCSYARRKFPVPHRLQGAFFLLPDQLKPSHPKPVPTSLTQPNLQLPGVPLLPSRHVINRPEHHLELLVLGVLHWLRLLATWLLDLRRLHSWPFCD